MITYLGTFCTSLQLAHYHENSRSDLRTMSNLLLLQVFELISLKYNYDFYYYNGTDDFVKFFTSFRHFNNPLQGPQSAANYAMIHKYTPLKCHFWTFSFTNCDILFNHQAEIYSFWRFLLSDIWVRRHPFSVKAELKGIEQLIQRQIATIIKRVDVENDIQCWNSMQDIVRKFDFLNVTDKFNYFWILNSNLSEKRKWLDPKSGASKYNRC